MNNSMKIHQINKVLIANRGEIAVRVIKTLKKLNITSVAVFSSHDKQSWFAQLADEAWPLGEGTLKETYLNIDKIIEIALKSGAEAIHPGYGFLSENHYFAQACENNGLIFIGPDANTIRLMGNKIEARKTAIQNGMPVTKGITGNVEELLQQADSLPFPVLVKAAAGGGGKGMRIVHDSASLDAILKSTSREAESYFGDGTVYIEQFIEEPRHIEVQVLGDGQGNIIHLYERECSIQRRYQKIIEESPSPTLTPELREKMGAAAVKLCSAIGYRSAGTIEFLVDKNLNFYFLEMNTRIQVEHPVTEMVTGYDLVEEQLLIAQGYPLRIQQENVRQNGHAIECRIYAEDPATGFLPSPGNITLYSEPEMPFLRIDSSMNEATEVLSFFDPMISKVVAWGESRNQALNRASNALKMYAIHGIKTNISYLQALLEHVRFIENKISTGFCDQTLLDILEETKFKRLKVDLTPVIAAFLLLDLNRNYFEGVSNIWEEIGYWRHSMSFNVEADGKVFRVEPKEISDGKLTVLIEKKLCELRIHSFYGGKLIFEFNNTPCTAFVSEDKDGYFLIQYNGLIHRIIRFDQLNESIDHSQLSAGEDDGNLFSPMPGKVIQINVKEDELVNRGKVLIVVEAMKMENNIVSPGKAIVEKINVKIGDMVDNRTQLIHLNELDD
jgi:3-methylcrotonyl-CoA carboxylase alpha subunit